MAQYNVGQYLGRMDYHLKSNRTVCFLIRIVKKLVCCYITHEIHINEYHPNGWFVPGISSNLDIEYLRGGKVKYTFRLAVMILCSCLVLALFARQINFTEDTSNFANPERGYAPSIDPSWPSAAPWDFCGTGNNFTA